MRCDHSVLCVKFISSPDWISNLLRTNLSLRRRLRVSFKRIYARCQRIVFWVWMRILQTAFYCEAFIKSQNSVITFGFNNSLKIIPEKRYGNDSFNRVFLTHTRTHIRSTTYHVSLLHPWKKNHGKHFAGDVWSISHSHRLKQNVRTSHGVLGYTDRY